MKVLWLVQNPMNFKKGYNGGGWISSLQRLLHNSQPDLSLTIAYWGQNSTKSEEDGVAYYEMQEPKMSKLKKLSYRLRGDYVNEEESEWPAYRKELETVVREISPDIIHIFGSESRNGLISGHTSVPVVIHIQGILNPYLNSYLPPFVSKRDYNLKDGLNPRKIMKNYFQFYNWEKMTHCEREILRNTKYYLGRTEWDYRLTCLFNPQAVYFHCDEVLRESFYIADVKREYPTKLKIVSTISIPPYKGYDVVLKTAKLLKSLDVDFEWTVFGNVQPSLMEKKFGIKHEDVNVRLYGVASQEQIKEQLLSSTVYVHPSYIDNSPNSVCEAQMCKLPVIAANVGGVCSMVENEKTGYLVPANDPYQTAYLIMHLFKNKDVAERIADNAYQCAIARHDKNKIVQQLLSAYNKMLS